MEQLIEISKKFSDTALKVSLGIVLLWIGALKFADPSPVVGLLDASISFLASNGFVYALGVLEVIGGLLFLVNKGVRYVALFNLFLFLGTIVILIVAPVVSYGDAGFPLLTLPGEFLLKDLVLFAASFYLLGRE